MGLFGLFCRADSGWEITDYLWFPVFSLCYTYRNIDQDGDLKNLWTVLWRKVCLPLNLRWVFLCFYRTISKCYDSTIAHCMVWQLHNWWFVAKYSLELKWNVTCITLSICMCIFHTVLYNYMSCELSGVLPKTFNHCTFVTIKVISCEIKLIQKWINLISCLILVEPEMFLLWHCC